MYLSGKARTLGVIGHPIGHSLSPAMQNAAIQALGLDCVYVPFDVAPENLGAAVEGIRALGIVGMNVTIPHKESVIPFLDCITEDAARIGSVNTIHNLDGALTGSSTDGAGFLMSLEGAGFQAKGCKACILGAGGSARAVAFALAGVCESIALLNRSVDRAENLANEVMEKTGGCISGYGSGVEQLKEHLREADLVVNCTSLGMYPNPDDSPVPSDLIKSGMMVYDLVYNPMKTRLLSQAEAAGARAIGGVKMLVNQGAISFKTWLGVDPPTDVMEIAVVNHLDK